VATKKGNDGKVLIEAREMGLILIGFIFALGSSIWILT
jgi:hypothetical protein